MSMDEEDKMWKMIKAMEKEGASQMMMAQTVGISKKNFLHKYAEWQKNPNVYDGSHAAMERIQAVYMTSEAIAKKPTGKKSPRCKPPPRSRMATTRTRTWKKAQTTTNRKRSTMTTQTQHMRPCLNVIGASYHPTPPRPPPTPTPPIMKPSTPQNYHQTNPMYRKPQKNRLQRKPPTPPEPQPPMKKPPKQISTQHDQRKHHQVAKLSAIPYPGGTVCARLRHQL